MPEPRRNTKGHKQCNLYIPTMTRNQLEKMYPDLPFTKIVNRALKEHVSNNYEECLRRIKREEKIRKELDEM